MVPRGRPGLSAPLGGAPRRDPKARGKLVRKGGSCRPGASGGPRRGWRCDCAAWGAGPPGRRPRRRRRPRDPRTPRPAAAPPSSDAAAEGNPAATTHGPMTSGVARRTSQPACSCARSPPPARNETYGGRAPSLEHYTEASGRAPAPARYTAAPTHTQLPPPVGGTGIPSPPRSLRRSAPAPAGCPAHAHSARRSLHGGVLGADFRAQREGSPCRTRKAAPR